MSDEPIANVNGRPWTFRPDGDTWVPHEEVVPKPALWRGPVCERCGGKALGTVISIVCQSETCGHAKQIVKWPL